MLNSANSCCSLANDKIKQAFIYIANILHASYAQLKPGTIQIKTTNCLMQIMIAQIYKSKVRSHLELATIISKIEAESTNDCSGFTKELHLIDLVEFFYRNPEFSNLTAANVEDIGIVYDILQNYKVKIKDSKLMIVNCSKFKKKQGSFYTPIYIVDFIIEKTLGRFVDELASKYEQTESVFDELLKIRILDPSVGGGIFLIRAARFLQSWIRITYPKVENTTYYEVIDKFITRCLFGFDVNKTACYLSKMSLMLLMRKPIIGNQHLNISCANSLDLISKNTETNKFDIVISNPPFQFGENIPKLKKSTSGKYELATGQFDIYWLFYELAIKKLLKNDGFHGYIIPDSLMTRDEALKMRSKLLEKTITDIWHIGAAFNSLHVSAIVLIWQNRKPADCNKINVADKACNTWKIKQQTFNNNNKLRFLIYLASDDHTKIISKMADGNVSVGDIFEIHRGEEIGKKALASKGNIENGILCGDNVRPYRVTAPSLYLKDLNEVKKSSLFKNRQVIIRKTGANLIAAINTKKHMFLQSVYCVQLLDNCSQKRADQIYKALVGFLNSKLVNFYVRNTFTAYKLVYPQLNQSTIAEIPLPANFLTADWSELIDLVEKLMKNSENNPESLQADIDAIVYSAYNLSDNEIGLINNHQTSLSFKR